MSKEALVPSSRRLQSHSPRRPCVSHEKLFSCLTERKLMKSEWAHWAMQMSFRHWKGGERGEIRPWQTDFVRLVYALWATSQQNNTSGSRSGNWKNNFFYLSCRVARDTFIGWKAFPRPEAKSGMRFIYIYLWIIWTRASKTLGWEIVYI